MHSYSGVLALLTAFAAAMLRFKPQRRTTAVWVIASSLILCIAFPRLRAQSPTPDSSLQAQNITGAWQGSLKAGDRQLRIVFKISLEDDKLKAAMYSIDQEGQGIPASTITRNGSTLKITVAEIGGYYEGKLTAGGKSIAGTWTQRTPLLLNLARATPETAWAIPDPLPPPKRMPADATPVWPRSSQAIWGRGQDSSEPKRAS